MTTFLREVGLRSSIYEDLSSRISNEKVVLQRKRLLVPEIDAVNIKLYRKAKLNNEYISFTRERTPSTQKYTRERVYYVKQCNSITLETAVS